jgi:hypothetical protein
MIPTDKLVSIAEKLLAKSRANQAAWGIFKGKDQGFLLTLPGALLVVQRFRPASEPDYMEMWVANEEGHRVGEWIAEEPSDNYQLLLSLYNEAERITTGWDHVLEKIETALDIEGTVGEPDIPF